eukprot:GEZU01039767.1.p1 GENE.GEZU01039767.1~~GEZU01039767.1.p1  ORF type:complete len:386 (+),score=99.50 GEZU01039767.1:43-1158(+)
MELPVIRSLKSRPALVAIIILVVWGLFSSYLLMEDRAKLAQIEHENQERRHELESTTVNISLYQESLRAQRELRGQIAALESRLRELLEQQQQLESLNKTNTEQKEELARIDALYKDLETQLARLQQKLRETEDALLKHNVTSPSGGTWVPSALFPNADKMIVISQWNEDISWIDIYLGDYPHVVYTKNKPGGVHNMEGNKGQEAQAYLKFVLDYYDNLPANVLFLHAHRSAWHTKMENIDPVIRNLRWGAYGYLSVNYKEWHRIDDKHDATDYNFIKQHWAELFEDQLGPFPPYFELNCCAQFAVTRERIRARPKAFYQRLYNWLMNTTMENYWNSRVFEHTWPMIFGESHQGRRCDECCTTTLPHCQQQ